MKTAFESAYEQTIKNSTTAKRIADKAIAKTRAELIPYKTDPTDITHVYIDENLSVPRHIVCAANKVGDLIICGARHHDNIMRAMYKALGLDNVKTYKIEEQGFIDQYQQFVTREDAAIIVEANGQKLRAPIEPGKTRRWCFSENLY